MSSSSIVSSFKSLNEEQLTDLIRVSEITERYSDMCKFTKELINLKTKNNKSLNLEERNLFSVAYKNVVGSKRAAFRTMIGGFENSDEELVEKFRTIVEDELEVLCKEVISLISDKLMKCLSDDDKNSESEVFYLKMIGDYYRYLCEFRGDNETYKKQGELYYSKAFSIASKVLPETHPTRLGLCLNYSVFYYEIVKEVEKACKMAKESFDLAIEKLDTLRNDSYRDATLIMQLLRDNLTLWTSEQMNNDDSSHEE